MSTALTWDWNVVLKNPDPPRGAYRYRYLLRAGGAWEELAAHLRAMQADRLLLVTERTFPQSLAALVQQRLAAVAPCVLLLFAGGEAAKGLRTVAELCDEAVAAGATRRSVVVALGGGVAGNVAGLLAGVLFRGVRLVQVPTTLLAMSDSCLSLKQGVNGAHGKNHVGLFYPPVLVWSDLALLSGLPRREVRSALCELIKNVLAICPERLADVQQRLRPAADYSDEEYAWFIALCLDAKCTVMRRDALEKHEALVLEYGHSIGHALELATGLPHGLAIGVGMVVEARIAFLLGLLPEEAVETHVTLLSANGAPTSLPAEATTDVLLPLLAKDNKRGYLVPKATSIDLVLLRALGVPQRTNGTLLTQVDSGIVREALEWSRAQSELCALAPASAPVLHMTH